MTDRAVVVLGETLVDFVPSRGSSEDLVLRFDGHPGGAPANVAVGLRRLGVRSRLITKLGDDAFGRFLHSTLVAYGVDVSGVRSTREGRTGLTFVTLTDGGERSFEFFCDRSADQLISVDEIDPRWIRDAGLFHFGTFTLAHEPSRSATLRAVDMAKEGGAVVSADLNLRLAIWDDLEAAREVARAVIARSDIVKMSAEEALFVFPDLENDEAALAAVLRLGPRLAAITDGASGGCYATQELVAHYPGLPAMACDTTGAGDAFMAALLSQIAGLPWPTCLVPETLHDVFAYAAAAGALATEGFGGMSSMPDHRAIVNRLKMRASTSHLGSKRECRGS